MVKKYIKTCDLCQRNKQIKHTREPLNVIDTPTKSFETLQRSIQLVHLSI